MKKYLSQSVSKETSHLIFLLILLGAFVFLVARAWTMYPSVFPDEYVHSRAARLIPLKAAEIPGYLYYWVYSFSGLFGDDFLVVARILNAAFFSVGCYFVYLTARRLTSPYLSMLIGVISVLSPMNTYTTYFMPESMFYFIFWIMVYFLLNIDYTKTLNHQYWIKIGIVFGLMSLVKPHALFIYPSILLYIIMTNGTNRSTFFSLSTFTIAAIVIKYSIGYLAAGTSGMTLFGSMYTDHARLVIADPNLIMNAMRSISVNILGNFFLITSVLGLGIVCIFSVADRKEDSIQIQQVWILIWSMLLVLIPMVSVFSTSVALYDTNLDHRLYLRYYNYIFPLVYILIAAHSRKVKESSLALGKSLLGATFIVFILVLPYYHTISKFLYPFKIFMTDSPELYLLMHYSTFMYVISILGLILIVIWLYNELLGINLYLYLYLPTFVVFTTVSSFGVLSTRYQALPQDQLGMKYSLTIPKNEHGDIVIAGNNRLVVNHAAIYSSSGKTKLILNKFTNQLDANLIPEATKWLVTTDSLDVPNNYLRLWSADQMNIYQNITYK